jgi:hypothetical protein
MGRRRTTKKTSFRQRLAEEAEPFKEAAEQASPESMSRELLLRRARQAETAVSATSDFIQMNEYRVYLVGTGRSFRQLSGLSVGR